LNARFTFRPRYSIEKFFKYLVGVSVSIGTTYASSLLLHYVALGECCPIIALNAGAAIAAIVNYAFQRTITFRASNPS